MTPFVGFPNPTYQYQPDGPGAETEFTPSMAFEQDNGDNRIPENIKGWITN
jgi:hypothetical protein